MIFATFSTTHACAGGGGGQRKIHRVAAFSNDPRRTIRRPQRTPAEPDEPRIATQNLSEDYNLLVEQFAEPPSASQKCVCPAEDIQSEKNPDAKSSH